LHEHRDKLVLLDLRGGGNLDFELFCNLDEFGLRLLCELRRGLYRWRFYLRKLLVERGWML
jgi:hypothetical protein